MLVVAYFWKSSNWHLIKNVFVVKLENKVQSPLYWETVQQNIREARTSLQVNFVNKAGTL